LAAFFLLIWLYPLSSFRWPPKLLSLPAIVFVVLSIVSSLTAVYPVDAWQRLFELLLFGLLFIAVINLVRLFPEYQKTIHYFFVGSALVQTLIGAHQVLFIGFYRESLPGFYQQILAENFRGGSYRAVGTFANANYFACFLNVALALSLERVTAKNQDRNGRILWSIASLVLLAGVFISASKMGMAISALILFYLLGRLDKRILMTFALLAILALVVPNPVQTQFIRGIQGDSSFGMRPGIWGASLEMTLARPLTGTGPGNYQYLSHLHAPEVKNEIARYGRFPRIAHNSYLQVFAEVGIPGGLAFLILIAVIARELLKLFNADVSGARDHPYAIGAAVAFVSVALHAMVDNTLNHFTLGFVLSYLLAAALPFEELELLERGQRMRSLLDRFGRVSLTTFSIVSVFLVWVVFIVRPAVYESNMEQIQNQYSQIAALEKSTRTVQQRITKLEALNNKIQSLREQYKSNLAVNRYSGQVNADLFSLTNRFEYFNQSIHDYRTADTSLGGKSREDVYSQLQLYLDLIGKGYPPSKEIQATLLELSDKTVQSWPDRAYFYMVAASLNLQMNDVNRGRELIDRAVELEPNYLQAYVFGDRIGVLTGNNEYRQQMQQGFTEAIQRIRTLGPPDADDQYGKVLISLDRRFSDQDWIDAALQQVNSTPD
jgi:O-antigen ligase